MQNKIPLQTVTVLPQNHKSNLQRYIHKYINSRINISVYLSSVLKDIKLDDIKALQKLEPYDYSEMLSVSQDSIGVLDVSRMGEQKEFCELVMHYFFNSEEYVYVPEFNDIEYLKVNQPKSDNPYLEEYVTVFEPDSTWNPLKNIGKIYFETDNIVYSISENGQVITLSLANNESSPLLVIRSDNKILLIGNHEAHHEKLSFVWDFLTLLKLNVYQI